MDQSTKMAIHMSAQQRRILKVHGRESNINDACTVSYYCTCHRRPSSSVQRGSAQFSPMLAGDPTTPGWAAAENASRVSLDESIGVPRIPSLPISYEDALPLLKAVENRGSCNGDEWHGGLNDITYCSGPSEGEVHLVNIVENKHTPIWNVIGRIQGKEEPDHAVILGES